MPGTPVIQPEPKAAHIDHAHRKAIEIASQATDPILNPYGFQNIYWIVMGGYGFAPYVIGRTAY